MSGVVVCSKILHLVNKSLLTNDLISLNEWYAIMKRKSKNATAKIDVEITVCLSSTSSEAEASVLRRRTNIDSRILFALLLYTLPKIQTTRYGATPTNKTTIKLIFGSPSALAAKQVNCMARNRRMILVQFLILFLYGP